MSSTSALPTSVVSTPRSRAVLPGGPSTGSGRGRRRVQPWRPPSSTLPPKWRGATSGTAGASLPTAIRSLCWRLGGGRGAYRNLREDHGPHQAPSARSIEGRTWGLRRAVAVGALVGEGGEETLMRLPVRRGAPGPGARRARQHPARPGADAARGGGQGGPRPHLLTAGALSVLLRHRLRHTGRAHRHGPRGRGDPGVDRRGLTRVHLRGGDGRVDSAGADGGARPASPAPTRSSCPRTAGSASTCCRRCRSQCGPDTTRASTCGGSGRGRRRRCTARSLRRRRERPAPPLTHGGAGLPRAREPGRRQCTVRPCHASGTGQWGDRRCCPGRGPGARGPRCR